MLGCYRITDVVDIEVSQGPVFFFFLCRRLVRIGRRHSLLAVKKLDREG